MLPMGNATLLLRRIQDMGLSFLFLPPPSDSSGPFGLLVPMEASVTMYSLDLGFAYELSW